MTNKGQAARDQLTGVVEGMQRGGDLFILSPTRLNLPVPRTWITAVELDAFLLTRNLTKKNTPVRKRTTSKAVLYLFFKFHFLQYYGAIYTTS
jgi:hypothetical protein